VITININKDRIDRALAVESSFVDSAYKNGVISPAPITICSHL